MSDKLNPGDRLAPGESIVSQDGRFTLVLQASDSNLVLMWTGGPALWATGTAGQAATELAMQASDGNLVLNGVGRPLWASNTAGHPGAFLIVQNDGNLVVYDGTGPLWASNTVQMELRLEDARTRVIVSGSGFSPRNHVAINYSYQKETGGGTITHTAGSLDVITDDGANFAGAAFPVNPSDAIDIEVRATDVASGRFIDGSLRVV